MMFSKKYFQFLFLIFLLCAQIAAAQIKGFDKVGTTSFQFLKVVPNARSAAMGGVSSAVINSSEAVFFNPAALTKTSNLDFALSYVDWFLDVSITSFSLAYRISGIGTFGVQALATNIGDIEETSVEFLGLDEVTKIYNPGITGNVISPSSQVFGLSFARDLTNKFSFGATIKYARENLVVKTAAQLIYDFGVLYNTGYKSLKLGAMLNHFGPEVKFFDESYPLPQTFSIGISGNLVGPDDGLLFNNNNHRFFVAYDLLQTRDHSQQQHFGIEYLLKNILAIRGGYKFNYDEEAWTFGFGVYVGKNHLDYAYNDFGKYLNSVHRFTVRLAIH